MSGLSASHVAGAAPGMAMTTGWFGRLARQGTWSAASAAIVPRGGRVSRPRNGDTSRAPVAPLQRAISRCYEDGTVTWAGVARQMGWFREGRYKRTTCDGEQYVYVVPVADGKKVLEVLGLLTRREATADVRNQTIHTGMGRELALVCGLDPTELGLPAPDPEDGSRVSRRPVNATYRKA